MPERLSCWVRLILREPGRLLDALTESAQLPDRLASMAAAARTQAHPDAAERIADRLAALAKVKLAVASSSRP